MTKMPNLNDYPIEVLVCLANSPDNEFMKDNIKNILVDKIQLLNLPMFILINKFILTNNILKEVYAKVILMRLGNEEYNIENKLLDEILSLISLDDVVTYGSNVKSLEIRKKCEELFWVQALMVEDSSELNRKNTRYRRRVLVEKIKNGR